MPLTSKMPKPHPCRYKNCGKILPTSTKQREHEMTHTDERPHCQTCGAGYKQKDYAILHEKNLPKKTRLRCGHCNPTCNKPSASKRGTSASAR